ncbi:uncharacterized protein MELLADRAFT_78903 [Melampsora larici-populina 98AG31]|uniref:Uncharacterized protein n=1 Tax=Melampsora larici-populina (strain 98AG31 / pathotype 3-4-7) TaxID=747676 RepID=F4S0B9_MELLP|nr:uncharacterized protein MELLADRAFT_78903 [Melampsora larici-populina 98AG31]EGG01964.1 hypothetical protein MELLADRAFT_78903 [Melampsora larici-populina 98AG31]
MFVNTDSSDLSSVSSLSSLSSSSIDSDYFDVPTPPLSPSRQAHRIPPISMTADPVKFTLDMSFNRHGSNTNLEKRFACSIDPLAPPTSSQSRSDTSSIGENAGEEEWKALYSKWNFPVRTDSPRGLTWGPYHTTPDMTPSTSTASLPSSGIKRLRTSSNAENKSMVTEPKRQRLVPILRLPRNPLIVRLVMGTSKSTSQMNSTETVALRQTPTSMTFVETLTEVLVSLPTSKPSVRPRITLSRSSKLKYGV